MKIIDIVGYILNNYPHNYKSHLSKGRLNKLIYLTDWKSCIEREKQVSDIKWLFNHYGPYVPDIEEAIQHDNRITIDAQMTNLGNTKFLVKLLSTDRFTTPKDDDKEILDLVIDVTKSLPWNQFINTVYSTYPIKISNRGDYLDLVSLAKEYKRSK